MMEDYQCYGIDHADPNVCSERGACVAQDDCVCDQGWVGSNCEKCYYKLKGDINEDCVVNLLDLAHLVSVWLVDCIVEPDDIECIAP